MQGFKFVSTSKKRYNDRNLQGDSRYNREKIWSRINLYPALKQFAIKQKFNYIGVAIITNAIKFVQMDLEKLMSEREDDKESKEPDYDNDRNQLEENQEQETGEQEATSNAS